jgi:hypothetical protein
MLAAASNAPTRAAASATTFSLSASDELLAQWTHEAAGRALRDSIDFVALQKASRSERGPGAVSSTGEPYAMKWESRFGAADAAAWEPGWTMAVATVPILGERSSPECLEACSGGRRCCARCGMYSRGSWKATDDPSMVEKAVGPRPGPKLAQRVRKAMIKDGASETYM